MQSGSTCLKQPWLHVGGLGYLLNFNKKKTGINIKINYKSSYFSVQAYFCTASELVSR